MARLSALVLVIGLGSTACTLTQASVGAMRSGPPLSPKPDDCLVRMWATQKPQAGTYDEIATIEITSSIGTPLGQKFARLRQEACRVGADAVIITINQRSAGSNVLQAVAIIRSPPRVDEAPQAASGPQSR